jgi:hypothetical protein
MYVHINNEMADWPAGLQKVVARYDCSEARTREAFPMTGQLAETRKANQSLYLSRSSPGLRDAGPSRSNFLSKLVYDFSTGRSIRAFLSS